MAEASSNVQLGVTLSHSHWSLVTDIWNSSKSLDRDDCDCVLQLVRKLVVTNHLWKSVLAVLFAVLFKVVYYNDEGHHRALSPRLCGIRSYDKRECKSQSLAPSPCAGPAR
jgi:hypothetical protein